MSGGGQARRRATLRAGVMLAVLLASATAVAREPAPEGAPQPDRTVRDPEFGVSARHFGLERRVEMLQWQLTAHGYVRVWSARAIDSSGYAPGHVNPPFPLQGRRWMAHAVSVDGEPLDPSVLERLGHWRDFRPGFSALPGNLAVTFQPQGDGLGSADNPLAPEIGDLRIHWRELVLPPLDGRVLLRDGRWQLAPEPDGSARAPQPSPPQAGTRPQARSWLFGGAVAVLIIALAVRRRRRNRSR